MAGKRFPSFNVSLDEFTTNQQVQLKALLRQLILLRESDLNAKVYTDANRPAAGATGKIIFNSDDGQLNIDDGTNWTLPDGTTT